MKKYTLIGLISVALPLLAIADTTTMAKTATTDKTTTTTNSVAYPDSYRSWTHVKSMVIHPDHSLADPFEGIHHVYANDAALAGLESKTYQKGATMVFDLFSQKLGGGATQEGERKFIGVMEYDTKRFAATGGWGFEVFPGNSTTERGVKDGGTSCFGCHQAAKADSYVFSKYRK